jgi:hypothetical protein
MNDFQMDENFHPFCVLWSHNTYEFFAYFEVTVFEPPTNTVPVGQGWHFYAEYLCILRKLVSAEAKNRNILEDSCFHHQK